MIEFVIYIIIIIFWLDLNIYNGLYNLCEVVVFIFGFGVWNCEVGSGKGRWMWSGGR